MAHKAYKTYLLVAIGNLLVLLYNFLATSHMHLDGEKQKKHFFSPIVWEHGNLEALR